MVDDVSIHDTPEFMTIFQNRKFGEDRDSPPDNHTEHQSSSSGHVSSRISIYFFSIASA